MSVAFNSNSGEAGGEYLNLMDVDDDLRIQSKYGGGSQTSVCVQWRKRWTGAAAVCLGLLCLLLLALIIGLVIYYTTAAGHHDAEMQDMQTKYENLTNQWSQLQSSYNSLTAERDELKINSSNLAKEKAALQDEVHMIRKPCRQGWIKFNNTCYYISTESKNWDKSRRDCQDRRADLAIINSKEEHNFLSRFQDTIWIGLSDKHAEGKWQWVDGTFLEGGGFWQDGEPNNADGAEDCVEVSRGGGGWNDVPCSNRLSWACEE
ncbi:CD209 antigen-like protein C [Centroberyx affinis]|uniref:CD209 antigen-like protein C n=1 Tax=Centroberyx affinis TaxID=166261 RepID=UPI003A5BC03B